MTKYKVDVYATKRGSSHMNNAVFRSYVVEAEDAQAARHAAIDAAYKDNDIEHVNPRTVVVYRSSKE